MHVKNPEAIPIQTVITDAIASGLQMWLWATKTAPDFVENPFKNATIRIDDYVGGEPIVCFDYPLTTNTSPAFQKRYDDLLQKLSKKQWASPWTVLFAKTHQQFLFDVIQGRAALAPFIFGAYRWEYENPPKKKKK